MAALRDLSAIQANNFVKMVIPDTGTLTFSDYHTSYTIDSVAYTGLGSLLAITDTVSELRSSSSEVSVSIAGIPISQVATIINSQIVASEITIYRVFFDSTTGAALDLDIGNPLVKFRGRITNYTIQDDRVSVADSGTGTIVITITASSEIATLEQKISGRRTNPVDHRRLYPTDPSMDRVPTIARSNYNFGGSQ